MDLCPPFEGWRLTDDGTIITPSGYRCTPLSIEGALWMLELYRNDGSNRRLMLADTYNSVEVFGLRDLQLENNARLEAIARDCRKNPCGREHSNAKPAPYPHYMTRMSALRRMSRDGRIIVRSRRN